MSLPNNWNMAENRLMHLKRWFQKDFKFYEDDNKFVEEIIRGMQEKLRLMPLMEEDGIYHIMMSITHIKPANREWCLNAALN